MKLRTFIEKEYLPHAERTLKPKTYKETRRLLVRHVAEGKGIGQMAIDAVRRRDIDALHARVASRTPTTANRLIAAISSVYRLGVRWERCEHNPCSGIHRAREKARERYFNPGEVSRIKAAAEKMARVDRAFILALMYTGARPSELQALDYNAIISMHNGAIRLADSKTGARMLYVPENCRDEVWEYWGGFHTINTQTLTRRIRRLTGIEDFRLYDLRHTFASAALAGGCTLEQIGQLLGHRNAQTTKRYVHLMPETGMEAAARAAGVLG